MTDTTAPQHTFLGRMLDTIERVGNKVPHPAIIFVILIVGVIILSQILYIVGASVTYEVVEPAAHHRRGGLPARQRGRGPAGPGRGRAGRGHGGPDRDDGGRRAC